MLAGVLAVLWVPATQRMALNSYLGGFFRGMVGARAPIRRSVVFAHTAADLEHVAVVVWLAGLWPWGPLAVLSALFLRGFALGFGLGFLGIEQGPEGVAFGLLAAVPSSLLSLPVLAWGGALSLQRSWALVRSWRDGRRPPPVRNGYAAAGMLIVVALVPAALVAGYLVPSLVRWTAPWFGL